MMHKKLKNSMTITRMTNSHQNGMITLLMAVVLLFAISSLTMFGVHVSVMEQRVSANVFRSHQAFEAAQAGIDASMALLDRQEIRQLGEANGGVVVSTYPTETLTDSFENPVGTYTVSYETIEADNYDHLKVSVIGTSSDNTSIKTLEQEVDFVPYISYPPPATVVAHTSVYVKDALLDNQSKDPYTNDWWDAVIWSGGNSQIINTTIPATTSELERIYEHSNKLKPLSDDGFFENFFIETRGNVKLRSIEVSCSPTACNTANLPQNEGLVWVTGTLTIDNNYGSQENPVILIVEGTLKITSGATLQGLIYVDGNWDNGNNPGSINGAIIVNGSVKTSGGMNLIYDQITISNIQKNLGFPVRIAGTWRDL